MEKSSPVDMYQADIEELTKFINESTRPNLKRYLEEHKRNLVFLLEAEKKKAVKTTENTTTTTNSVKETKFLTVSKYALDSSEKFVK